jgi:hypothetical protein
MTGQIDYTHPFDLLFDQPTEEEIDWDKLIAAMKRSLGEIETEEKRETTTSTHSFDSGHREPEENGKQNSVCGLKSEEEMGEDGEDREDGRTEEFDIAGYGLTVSPTSISSSTSFYVAGRARRIGADNLPILIPSTTPDHNHGHSSPALCSFPRPHKQRPPPTTTSPKTITRALWEKVDSEEKAKAIVSFRNESGWKRVDREKFGLTTEIMEAFENGYSEDNARTDGGRRGN